MTYSSQWAGNDDKLGAGGTQIGTYDPKASLYIHAKAILVDYGTSSARAFVGPENSSMAEVVSLVRTGFRYF